MTLTPLLIQGQSPVNITGHWQKFDVDPKIWGDLQARYQTLTKGLLDLRNAAQRKSQ